MNSIRYCTPRLTGWIFALLLSGTALAAVPADQVARLDRDLTPLGAERVGNTEGTIPAWEGGISEPPAGFVSGEAPVDPFAGDTLRFTITPANLKEHETRLTDGQTAMFKAYPTYTMPVYPTRRSAAYPKAVYRALKQNAESAQLQERGTGVKNTRMTSPFPIPQSGLEVIWNHILRYRGAECAFRSSFATVQPDGSFNLVTSDYNYLFVYAQPDVDLGRIENKIFYLKTDVVAPPKLAGSMNLVHETLDQIRAPRQAWRYEAGQRRLRRIPNLSYDSEVPNSNGMRTVDQVDMYNGAPDQYTWDLLGKREIYIPYNAYRLKADGVKSATIIRPKHMNQELARYELHRVWVVEGTLRVGLNHLYHKRRMYFDEDSWQIVLTEEYDDKNTLWRVSEAHAINYYEVPVLWTALELTYDLKSGRYFADGLDDEGIVRNFNPGFSEKDFSTSAVRREAKR